MPQVDTFMAEKDIETLVSYIFENDCFIVADRDYEKPMPELIYSIEDFLKTRCSKQSTLYFILSDSWQKTPLIMKPFIKDGIKRFFIQQKSGGPTIDLFAPYEFESGKGKLLPHGFLGFHNRFWNNSTEQNESAPEELKLFYRKIKKYITNQASVVSTKNREFFIAHWAQARLEKGIKLGAPFN